MPLALGNKLFFAHTTQGDDALVFYVNPNPNTHIALLTVKFLEGGSSSDLDGYVGLLTQKFGGKHQFGANVTNLHYSPVGMDFYNIGLDLAIKGPFTFKADVEYQTGDASTTTDAAGYAAMVDGSVKAGPMDVGLMVAYGSGDDDAADNDDGIFENYLSDTRYQSTIVGYRFATPTLGVAGANSIKNTGISNITMAQVYLKGKGTCPITKKPLSSKVRLNYMMLNEVPTGWDDDLGVELDAILTWALSNGLAYKVEAAYMLAGDAWKKGIATADPDDMYFLRHSLEISF
jgi:hypothetical protein